MYVERRERYTKLYTGLMHKLTCQRKFRVIGANYRTSSQRTKHNLPGAFSVSGTRFIRRIKRTHFHT